MTWSSVPNPNLNPNPPSPIKRETIVNVIGPSTIKLDQGSGELTAFNSPVHFFFRPYASGNRILGPYVSPTVEERIRRDGLWSAWSNSADFAWRSEVAAIDDIKTRGWNPTWGPQPIHWDGESP